MNIGLLLGSFIILILVQDAYTARNDCCFFPFKYNGKEYNRCIKKGAKKYWCATAVNDDGTFPSNKWNYCDSSCKTGICKYYLNSNY